MVNLNPEPVLPACGLAVSLAMGTGLGLGVKVMPSSVECLKKATGAVAEKLAAQVKVTVSPTLGVAVFLVKSTQLKITGGEALGEGDGEADGGADGLGLGEAQPHQLL